MNHLASVFGSRRAKGAAEYAACSTRENRQTRARLAGYSPQSSAPQPEQREESATPDNRNRHRQDLAGRKSINLLCQVRRRAKVLGGERKTMMRTHWCNLQHAERLHPATRDRTDRQRDASRAITPRWSCSAAPWRRGELRREAATADSRRSLMCSGITRNAPYAFLSEGF
jgi:hypothetical protein